MCKHLSRSYFLLLMRLCDMQIRAVVELRTGKRRPSTVAVLINSYTELLLLMQILANAGIFCLFVMCDD